MYRDTETVTIHQVCAVSRRDTAIHLRTRVHRALYTIHQLCDVSLMYRDTAIQRDTSNLMYHHPSDVCVTVSEDMLPGDDDL